MVKKQNKIGYIRVSTDDQNLDLQRDALIKSGCREIYEDKATGKNTDRPELHQCLRALREGDTLVIWRLDRLGRSLSDLVRIIEDLEKSKIAVESLCEKIETSSAAGRMVWHFFAMLAEYERNLIRERTLAGLKAARARGRMGGRPSKLGPKEIREIRALLRDPLARVTDVAKRYGVSRTTLYKHVGAVQPKR